MQANKKWLCHFRIVLTGEMAEWSIVAVSKTVEPQGSGGSNPPLSDKKEREYSCGGFETRSQPPWEEEGTEGGPEGANPPLSDKKEREYSCGGFETRSRCNGEQLTQVLFPVVFY